MRVVSLLPSATELLCAIPGGTELLVGRSHECDWPESIQDVPILTAQRTTETTSAAIDAEVRATLHTNDSLYTLDRDALIELEPDVIITQDLCNVCSIDLQAVQRVAHELPNQPEAQPQPSEHRTGLRRSPACRHGMRAGIGSAACRG